MSFLGTLSCQKKWRMSAVDMVASSKYLTRPSRVPISASDSDGGFAKPRLISLQLAGVEQDYFVFFYTGIARRTARSTRAKGGNSSGKRESAIAGQERGV